MVIIWTLLYLGIFFLGILLTLSLLPIFITLNKLEYDSEEFFYTFCFINSKFLRLKYSSDSEGFLLVFLDRFSYKKTEKKNIEEPFFKSEENNEASSFQYEEPSVDKISSVELDSVNTSTIKESDSLSSDASDTQELSTEKKDNSRDTLDSTEKHDLDNDSLSRKERWGSRWRKVKSFYKLISKQKKSARKVFRWGKSILYSMFKIIRFRGSDVNIGFGLEDPADTGKVYGYIISFIYGSNLNGIYGVNLSVEPVFENRDLFNFQGTLKFKTSIFTFAFWGVKALLTFPYIQAYFSWQDFKKRRD